MVFSSVKWQPRQMKRYKLSCNDSAASNWFEKKFRQLKTTAKKIYQTFSTTKKWFRFFICAIINFEFSLRSWDYLFLVLVQKVLNCSNQPDQSNKKKLFSLFTSEIKLKIFEHLFLATHIFFCLFSSNSRKKNQVNIEKKIEL